MVSFTKNGEDMGVAFEFTEELGNQALFPHVLIKNAEFMVNFGSQVTAFHQVVLFVCFLSHCCCVSVVRLIKSLS